MVVHNTDACFQFTYKGELVEKCYPYSRFNFNGERKVTVRTLRTDTHGQLSDEEADNIRKFHALISRVRKWSLANDEDVRAFLPQALRRGVLSFEVLENCRHFSGEHLLEEFKDLVAVINVKIGMEADNISAEVLHDMLSLNPSNAPAFSSFTPELTKKLIEVMAAPSFQRIGKIWNSSYGILFNRQTNLLEITVSNNDLYILSEKCFSSMSVHYFEKIHVYYSIEIENSPNKWGDFVARCQEVFDFRLIPMENAYEITISELLLN